MESVKVVTPVLCARGQTNLAVEALLNQKTQGFGVQSLGVLRFMAWMEPNTN
jgi:hypothetical protein